MLLRSWYIRRSSSCRSGLYALFRLKNAAGAAVIAQVLLITVAIVSIEENIVAATFSAAVDVSFTHHRAWSQEIDTICFL